MALCTYYSVYRGVTEKHAIAMAAVEIGNIRPYYNGYVSTHRHRLGGSTVQV